jgi:hypothetical protein
MQTTKQVIPLMLAFLSFGCSKVDVGELECSPSEVQVGEPITARVDWTNDTGDEQRLAFYTKPSTDEISDKLAPDGHGSVEHTFIPTQPGPFEIYANTSDDSASCTVQVLAEQGDGGAGGMGGDGSGGMGGSSNGGMGGVGSGGMGGSSNGGMGGVGGMGNCIGCEAYLYVSGSLYEDVCPASLPQVDALLQCACSSSCIEFCGTTCISDEPLSTMCTSCLQNNCPTEVGQCG